MENTINLDFKTLNLADDLQKALDRFGFKKMTEIQHKSIPLLLNRKDIIVKSHTGSGKTLCFVIPIVEDIFRRNRTGIVGVIITPTRELAIQTNDILNQFNVKSTVCIGGIELEKDFESLKTTKVVVATPGRLFEIVKHNPKLFIKVSSLVLDESDELISLGFSEKVLDIISLLPKKRITSLFSATINEGVQKLSLSLLKNPIFVEGESLGTPQELRLHYLEVLPEEKLAYTLNLIEGKKSIVFFSTCNQVEFFYTLFKENNNLLKIHGKMRQEERSQVYKEFDSTNGVLFCTDVAARGIDFKDIEIIVHFDVPKDYNTIIHRSGRSARNGKEGEAILFIMPNEKTYIDYLKIKNVEISPFKSFTPKNLNLRHLMDEKTLDLSVKAFVSYIRSYKEHNLNYILDFNTHHYDSIAELFMLEKIPGMFELKNVEFKKFPKPEAKTKVKKMGEDIKQRKDTKKPVISVIKKTKQKHAKKRIKCKRDLKKKK